MRILVTGGAGFIGSHTVDALMERSHDVAVLDNLASGQEGRVNPRARLRQADLRDSQAVTKIVDQERPEVIYHLAAQMDVRRSVADPAFDAQVNLVGLINLMEAARGRELKRVIFASSGGAIYGEQEFFPCDEDHPCNPVSPYGVAKLASERYLFFYRNEYGIGYTAMRYANVYGPRQDPHGEAGVVAIFCGRLLSGEPCTIYGDGCQTRDYVYVGDVARANVAALEHPADGAFNVGTGIETDVNQLYAELANLAGIKRNPVYAAARPGEQRRSVISPERIALKLGWQPKMSLHEGLAETFEYFKRKPTGPR
jgi:UDP-glucose 4-epimerase